MDIQNIVTQLKSELTRIGEVIGLLEGDGKAPVKKRVGRPPKSGAGKIKSGTRGRGITPAGRRKLSLAMKARWAQRKSAGASRISTPITAAGNPKKRSAITAAGRKKLSEAMKARWAAKKRKSS